MGKRKNLDEYLFKKGNLVEFTKMDVAEAQLSAAIAGNNLTFKAGYGEARKENG